MSAGGHRQILGGVTGNPLARTSRRETALRSRALSSDPIGTEVASLPGEMLITSSAFGNNDRIPSKYTCDGDDLSPPLVFEGVPRAASSLALVVDDPDAPSGTWTHWVVWDMPATTSAIAAGQAPAGVVGANSWRRNSYGGPCPPRGEHRYRFTLYALDTTMELPPAAGPRELARAMKGHVLATALLTGRYARRKS